MIKLFLTGEIQIGKSTAVSRALEQLDVCPSGFRTYFGVDRHSAEHSLYMCPANEPPRCDEEHAIAEFSAGEWPRFNLAQFEKIGLSCLADRSDARLILMDECGKLERDALRFQNRVLELLDGNTPILGVVRQDTAGWLDGIRHHPQTVLLTVTRENRDVIPDEIVRLLRAVLPK